MKILIITNMYPDRNPNFKYNGIFVKEQIDGLFGLGQDVECFIIDGFKSPFEYFKSIFSLRDKIKKSNYDVVHIHYGLSGLFLLFGSSIRRYSKFVLTLHGGDILKEQGKYFQVLLTKLIIRNLDFVITLNEDMNKVVSKLTSNFALAPCGVDTEFFSPSEVKKNKVILFAGAKSRPVKNYKLFEQIINEYRINKKEVETVALDGFNREEISNLLRYSSCLIMTSISEGSPQIIKEALSSDLAILSVDVGDVKKVCGIVEGTKIFSHSDAPAIIATYIDGVIEQASITPGKRRERIFEIGLSQNEVIKKLINIYERL